MIIKGSTIPVTAAKKSHDFHFQPPDKSRIKFSSSFVLSAIFLTTEKKRDDYFIIQALNTKA